MFTGLRTVVYPAPALTDAKDWWTGVLGKPPYYDSPHYVGFDAAGYELALDPSTDPAAGPIVYWGVQDAGKAYAELLARGATGREEPHDVGDSIVVGTVVAPTGTIVGVIENPHFAG
ncbi:glyoxalase [Dactylosporangium sp. NPDC049140]|uniref:VOC family protein n=1 Tax=Dactylosporangium sp. NPDC049140 TaxID=3155647 RepID=UPI0033D7A9E3